MRFLRDRQLKGYLAFLLFLCLLLAGLTVLFGQRQVSAVQTLYWEHDRAVVSSLLQQGISKEIIAEAMTGTAADENGTKFLHKLGIREEMHSGLLPFLSRFQARTFWMSAIAVGGFSLILGGGTLGFLWLQNRRYQRAQEIVKDYINGDFSHSLPQNSEGELDRLFALTEQLATMLQSKTQTERKTKEFLKSTISDISHQLKTPLAALVMYQEIIEAEPEHAETVREFAAKMDTALKRMEQLIQAMLKITRLDAGSVLFNMREYPVREVVFKAVSELRTRAERENKLLEITGEENQTLWCDKDWTGEAIGNLVKNALDHTTAGQSIRITWEKAPDMLRIFVSDNGSGIAPEDIYHIFKRFYRSRHSLKVQGIGLGLPLAKSIIEGQNGMISVQSTLHEGTVFTLSFLTKS